MSLVETGARTSADSLVARIYEETETLFREVRASPLPLDGYKIMYGPAVHQPPILFIGYQPGGKRDDEATETWASVMRGTPLDCGYATEKWLLAKRMQRIWGAELLSQCTGLNAIFFRAQAASDWSRLDRSLRERLEAFCHERAAEIVRALEPKRMVVIGLHTFDRLGGGEVVLRNDRRVLLKEGSVWGYPATGVIHLSGARPNKAELASITERLRIASCLGVFAP